jgi:hypothetical protein
LFHIFKVFFPVSDLDVKYIKFPTSLNRGSFLLIYDSIPAYPTSTCLQRPGRPSAIEKVLLGKKRHPISHSFMLCFEPERWGILHKQTIYACKQQTRLDSSRHFLIPCMDWWGICPTGPLPLPHHWRKRWPIAPKPGP